MSSGGGKHRTLGSGVQHVLEHLKRMQTENPSFFYAIEGDNEHSSGNIFWADATSRLNYSCFGDTVILETNRYKLPFIAFTGLNHHCQPVLFGSGLLLNESDTSIVWLIHTWLNAMPGNFPISITTEPDGLLQMCIARVLPETRHRFCRWSVLRETKEKLLSIYQAHLDFETEFNKCVNDSRNIDEFESSWESTLARYGLLDNEWLRYMYNARHQWVPVFLRDTFFGELSSSDSRDNCTSSYFHPYVNSETNIQTLMKQYERAVASWQEKELSADFETTNTTPILKTPSPMEKQAAVLYTRRLFLKFQEELVETMANPANKIEDSGTITIYRVAKFADEQNAHTVRFNSLEMKANCTCQKFEFSGIICTHILSVFRAKNVLTLPPEYILKRWTRNAKAGVLTNEQVTDFPNISQDSLVTRHNNLRKEAVKFVEEGAKAIHVYNVAMDALREASKKVAAVKKKQRSESNGAIHELHTGDENQTMPCQSADEEKEKKIRELTAKLESTNERCEVYRANLITVLRDMEEQKLKLAVNVQNARLSMKE